MYPSYGCSQWVLEGNRYCQRLYFLCRAGGADIEPYPFDRSVW